MSSRTRVISAGLSCCALMLTVSPAAAQPASPDPPATATDPAPSPLPPEPRAGPLAAQEAEEEEDGDAAELVWRWRRQAWYDYTATGLIVGGAAVELLLPIGLEQNEPRKTGGVLFDDAIRNMMVLGSNNTRQAFGLMSNVTLGIMATYPTVVDTAIVAWGVRRSPDVAWQMAMINLQSYALTSLFTGFLKRVADRERPVATVCADNPSYDDSCNNADKHYSFPSGHTSIAFAGASLMCLHHAELDLYGGDADIVACVAGMTTAALTGVGRIASDRHYATDVLSGAALGGLMGGVVPYLLYYAWDTPPDPEGALVMPDVTPDRIGLSVVGLF